jgi:hypothetical protein
MALKKITAGDLISASDHMYNFAEGFTMTGLNHIRQLKDRTVTYSKGMQDLWGEAYIDANGQNNSVVLASTGATFDTTKYKASQFPTGTEPFVIIQATSISAASDFAINNCLIGAIDTGKFILWCTTGTDEVRRAQIYKTLFYGSNGTDARAKTTYITGITAIKTSVARDVGKYAHYAAFSGSTTGTNGNITYTGTISSAGASNSVWSYVSLDQSSAGASCLFPVGTTVNSVSSNAVSDETGTNTTAEEQNSPASVQLYFAWSNASNFTRVQRCVLLTAGTVSWAYAQSGAFGYSSQASNINFNSAHSVPAFTATTETSADLISIVTMTIPSSSFASTISKAILACDVADWETGADLQYKLTNGSGGDTGWLSCGVTPAISSFTAFAAEPTTLTVKLIPKSSSPTAGYPSIRGVCIRATP